MRPANQLPRTRIIAGEPGQPSGQLSICKGVQVPTETLPTGQEASQRISLLFQAHALALKKLAFLMTGDQPTAEDIVQDAFLGLYRRWRSLQDTDNALGEDQPLAACRELQRRRPVVHYDAIERARLVSLRVDNVPDVDPGHRREQVRKEAPNRFLTEGAFRLPLESSARDERGSQEIVGAVEERQKLFVLHGHDASVLRADAR